MLFTQQKAHKGASCIVESVQWRLYTKIVCTAIALVLQFTAPVYNSSVRSFQQKGGTCCFVLSAIVIHHLHTNILGLIACQDSTTSFHCQIVNKLQGTLQLSLKEKICNCIKAPWSDVFQKQSLFNLKCSPLIQHTFCGSKKYHCRG